MGAVQVGAAKSRPWVCSPISVHTGSLRLNRWRAEQVAAVRTVSASHSALVARGSWLKVSGSSSDEGLAAALPQPVQMSAAGSAAQPAAHGRG